MNYWNYDDKEYAPPMADDVDLTQHIWLGLSTAVVISLVITSVTCIYISIDNYINKNKPTIELYNADNRRALLTEQLSDFRKQTTTSLYDLDAMIQTLTSNQSQLMDKYEELSQEQSLRTQTWMGVGAINDVVVTFDISRTIVATPDENARWLASEFPAGRDDRLFYKPTQYWTFSVGQNGEQVPSEPVAKKEYKKSDWDSVTRVKIAIDFPQQILQGKRFSQAMIDYLQIRVPDRHESLINTVDGDDTTLRKADVCIAILIRMINEEKIVWNKTTTTSK
jgi:hypothetical protein